MSSLQERGGVIWELNSKDQISKCGILVGICYRKPGQEEKVDQASFWRTRESVSIRGINL